MLEGGGEVHSMLIAGKVPLNSQVYLGFFSLKIYTMERDPYKQIKLAKNIGKTKGEEYPHVAFT